MIKDKLENGHKYDCLHKNFKMVMEILQSLNMEALEDGRIELDGDYVYINVDTICGKSKEEANFESHKRYIDIQVPISGSEKMGFAPVDEMKEPTNFDEAKDYFFYADRVNEVVDVEKGEFIIFFPEDAHAPMIDCGQRHKKLIVKVAVKPNEDFGL
ncbi:MAG: YhcH/YjgK/YiaL family protein [Paludibacteraceae bacterium]|nr:YhcH/YjgK/YiaL family protein [Paludibacteraceae bacterium]